MWETPCTIFISVQVLHQSSSTSWWKGKGHRGEEVVILSISTCTIHLFSLLWASTALFKIPLFALSSSPPCHAPSPHWHSLSQLQWQPPKLWSSPLPILIYIKYISAAHGVKQLGCLRDLTITSRFDPSNKIWQLSVPVICWRILSLQCAFPVLITAALQLPRYHWGWRKQFISILARLAELGFFLYREL